MGHTVSEKKLGSIFFFGLKTGFFRTSCVGYRVKGVCSLLLPLVYLIWIKKTFYFEQNLVCINLRHYEKISLQCFDKTAVLHAASMYFWSVSWSTNCPVYFSDFFVHPLIELTKNNFRSLRLDNSSGGDKNKMRNRPENWSTKRLTKSTWTPLLHVSRIY